MAQIVMEVFSLRADADEGAFLTRNEEVQAWSHAHRAGLLRRTVARNDRAWLVLWTWAMHPDDADTSADVPTLTEFIDASTYRTNSFTTL